MLNAMIGSGKSMTATISMMYEVYVLDMVARYSKYRRLTRKLKKRLGKTIVERIKQAKHDTK